MAHPEVAYCQEIHLGTKGLHVVAHKRAYSRAFPDLYPWPKKGHTFSDFAGEIFMRAVKTGNTRMGVKSSTVNLNAHNALEAKRAKNKSAEWAFDRLAITQAKTYCDNLAKKLRRESIVEAGFFWYAHRKEILYSQNRPFLLRVPPAVPGYWDCSAFVINCYYAVGAPDPSGRAYSGYGYTGDMWSRGNKIGYGSIRIGDLILYGFTTRPSPAFPYGSPTHVALYAGKGLVLSMGSYPMGYYAYNYRPINCIVTFPTS